MIEPVLIYLFGVGSGIVGTLGVLWLLGKAVAHGREEVAP